MNSFTIYKEYYELMTLLSEKDQQELLLAVVKYMFEDTIPTLNDKQMKIFANLKRPLDKSKTRSKAGSSNTSNDNQEENKMKSNQNQNENKKETKENQNQSKTKTHQDVNVIVKKENNIINNKYYNFLENQFGRTISLTEIEMFNYLLETYDKDLVKEAIKQSVIMTRKNLNYVKGILKNWKSSNINTLEDLKRTENDKERDEEQPEELFSYDWLNDNERN